MYSEDNLPDEVYEITIPHTNNLYDSIDNNQLGRYDNLDSKLDNQDVSDTLVYKTQKEIEKLNYYENQLSYGGFEHNIPSRYLNDYDDEDHIRDIVKEKYGAYVDMWSDITGLWYTELKESRYNLLDIREPKIHRPHSQLVALNLIGESEVSYCRCCSNTYPEDKLLYVGMRDTMKKIKSFCVVCKETQIL